MMRSRWLGFLIAALAAAASVWAYPRLPATVPTHWNLRGEPDGYSSRFLLAVLIPALLVLLTGFLQLLPQLDGTRPNDAAFLDVYWLMMNGVLFFVGAVHVALLANGVGAPVSPFVVIPIGMGLIFVMIGSHLGRVTTNRLIGIRTPWTIASESVWRKTHQTSRWLFVVCGLVLMGTGLFEQMTSLIVLFLVVAVVAVVPVVQSYVLWSREQTDENR